MNFYKCILLATALAFWACSEETSAGVAIDENTLAMESSSSVQNAEQPMDVTDSITKDQASTVVESGSSATAASVKSSSSSWIHVPSGGIAGCKAAAGGVRVETKSVLLSGNYSFGGTEPEDLLDSVITARLMRVSPEKVGDSAARLAVRLDLYEILGLDTLRDDDNRVRNDPNLGKSAYDKYASVTLNYVFEQTSQSLDKYIESGTFGDHSYCSYFKGKTRLSLSEDIFAFIDDLGCALGGDNYEYPLYTLENLWRKCMDLPYCNESNVGLVQRGGNKSYGLDEQVYSCDSSTWRHPPLFDWNVASTYVAQTFDKVCDKDGDYFISTVDSKVAYVCHVESGWDSTSTLQVEMDGKSCDTEGDVIQSPVSANVYYACQNGKWIFAENDGEGSEEKICNANGKTYESIQEKSGQTIINRCYNGVWYPSNEWTLDVPVEYYFNPDFEYGSFKDPRDGYVYRTTEFDGKTWLSENLQYKGGVNDTLVASQSICDGDSCKFLGRFYSAEAAQIACPEGWRLPQKSDLERMLQKERSYLDDEWFYMSASLNASGRAGMSDDRFGLSFIPAGDLLYIADYSDPPKYTWHNTGSPYLTAFWIKNDEETMKDPVYFSVGKGFKNKSSSLINERYKDLRMPVRCLKD